MMIKDGIKKNNVNQQQKGYKLPDCTIMFESFKGFLKNSTLQLPWQNTSETLFGPQQKP